MRPLLLMLLLASSVLGLVPTAAARGDWQADLHRWVVSNDTNATCRVRYAIGIYRADMGDKPAWGMMTEKMFKWFSVDGVKLAPWVCPATRSSKGKIAYRILFSVSPMKTVSQITHGSEVRTTTQPFNASVNSRTTYSDGSSANSTATVTGQQTATVVVPTETTISRSSVALYMYTYRADGGELELIGSDRVVFSRVAASGSGENAAGAELGAGIGNLIRASRDRHRSDKLFEEALKAIRADAADATDVQSTPAKAAMDIQRAPSLAQGVQQQAASGSAEAQYRLARLYRGGSQGVPQDYAEAVRWTRKAAEQGHVEAQYTLGSAYHVGQGVSQDYGEAYFWFDLAAAGAVDGLRPETTAKMRDESAIHLTPADLSREQERARKWFEYHPAKPQ